MAKNVDEYFVPWLEPLKMYVCDPVELAWQDPSLHRMMTNENPHAPSPKVMEAIQKYAELGNRYPDQGLVVRGKIAEINKLDGPENVVLGNGSCEIYDMIIRSFVQPGEEVIEQWPCFGIYKLRTNVIGGKIVSVPMIYKDQKLLFDADGILKAITPKTKLLIVAHPNNPSGNFMDDKDILRLADTGIPFIIDEAYIEYAGLQKTKTPLIKKYPNVIITRTLSKAYGLAGLRFGYLMTNKDVATRISATLIPWNVGTIIMWAALAALEDKEGLEQRVKFNNAEVEYIEEMLSSIQGLTLFHSEANYILFDGKRTGKKGADMVEYALKKGLILRPESRQYDSEGWFRVSIGTKEENRRVVEVIKEFYSK